MLEQIHDAALGTVPWDAVLGSVTKLFNANSAVITLERKQGGGWGVSTGGDASTHEAYFAHYAGVHPLASRAFAAPAGSILTDRMLMAKSEFERTEYYTDWARPLEFDEMLHVRLQTSAQDAVGLSLTRSSRAGEFEAPELALVRRLAPHLRRAVATFQRLSETLAAQHLMTEALDRMRRGVIGLDAAGRIVFANREAQRLLTSGDALRTEGRLLAANRPDRTAALRAMLRSAAVGEPTGMLALQRPHGRLPLVLEFMPVRNPAAALGLYPPAAVLLLVSDLENDRVPEATALRELYGLTATEAAVAIQTARGEGLESVARALGVAPSTVRSHLKRVFDKTDTHRQAELAWLVARLPA